MENKFKTFLLLALIAVLFTSCAHVQPDLTCLTGKVYGFWNGLWHGMVCPFTFIGSLFNHDVTIYAVNNNGAWYNFGFVLGVGGLGGGTRVVYKNKR